MEESLPALQPIAWGVRLKKVAKKAAGNALRVTASLLAFSSGQCPSMLSKCPARSSDLKGLCVPPFGTLPARCRHSGAALPG